MSAPFRVGQRVTLRGQQDLFSFDGERDYSTTEMSGLVVVRVYQSPYGNHEWRIGVRRDGDPLHSLYLEQTADMFYSGGNLFGSPDDELQRRNNRKEQ